MLTALKLLEVMKKTGKSLQELSEGLFIYPQLLKNVEVKDKNEVLNDPGLKELIASINKKLDSDGRILVRPSGTEPLIRVMVEAKTDELCKNYVDEVVTYIQERGF